MRGTAQDKRPRRVRSRDQPDGILAGLDVTTFELDVVAERYASGRVGAGVPDGIPVAECRVAEKHAPTSDRASVDHRDVGERDGLIDAGSLAERVPLSVTGRRTEHDERRQGRARRNGIRCHLSTIAWIVDI